MKTIVMSLIAWRHETVFLTEITDKQDLVQFLKDANGEDFSICVVIEQNLCLVVMIPVEDLQKIPPTLVERSITQVIAVELPEDTTSDDFDDFWNFSAN